MPDRIEGRRANIIIIDDPPMDISNDLREFRRIIDQYVYAGFPSAWVDVNTPDAMRCDASSQAAQDEMAAWDEILHQR